jgi:hypothetical protein
MAKGDSPYSTGFASGKLDYNLDPLVQMRQYEREEKETHSAPTTLPYEMGELPQYYANIVDNGLQACKVLEGLLKSKNVKHKESLINLKKNTEKAIMYFLKTVDPTLDKFVIGGKMESDDCECEDDDSK